MTAVTALAYDGPARAPRPEWFEYKSQNFSVSFPSQPRVGAMVVESDGVVRNGIAVGAESQRSAYILSCVEFDDQPGMSIDALPDVLRSRTEGRVLNKRDLRLQGFDGREYTIQNEHGTLIHRTYVINRWVYQLAVQTRRLKFERRNIDRFFESFRVERLPDGPVAISSASVRLPAHVS